MLRPQCCVLLPFPALTIIAAAATIATTATPIAQIDTPQSVPQMGAQGSQGLGGTQVAQGPGPQGGAAQGTEPHAWGMMGGGGGGWPAGEGAQAQG